MQEWHVNSIGGHSNSHSLFTLQQQVTCLSFSSFVPDLMVAGYSGGLIAVYSLRSSKALVVVQVWQSTVLPAALMQIQDWMYILPSYSDSKCHKGRQILQHLLPC